MWHQVKGDQFLQHETIAFLQQKQRLGRADLRGPFLGLWLLFSGNTLSVGDLIQSHCVKLEPVGETDYLNYHDEHLKYQAVAK